MASSRVAVGGLDPGLVDLELEGVEHDLVDRLGDVDVDGRPAGEGGRVEVGGQLELVAGRHDGRGRR